MPLPTAPATMVSWPRGKLMEICFRMGGVVFSFAAGGAADEPRPRPPREEGDEGSDWASAPALVAAGAASVTAVGVPSGFLRLTLKVSREVSERFGGALPPPRPPPPRPPPPLPLPLPLPLPASTSIFCQAKVPSIVMSASWLGLGLELRLGLGLGFALV